MFNFENYLLQELHSDKVVVLSEQMFVKNGEFDSNKIYVVVKYLASTIEFGAEIRPVQILVLSEQNGVQEAKDLFDSFTQTHNWVAGIFGDEFVKQQYSSPVVMSNFNEASYGYRSVLYVSATLFIMQNVCDVENLKINAIPIKPLNFSWSYQMTGNTQPIGGDMIASTVKNMATFQASISIPVLNNYELPPIEGDSVTIPTSQTPSYHVPVKSNYTITATMEGGTIIEINQTTGIITYTPDEIGPEISVVLTYNYEPTDNLLNMFMNISRGNLTGNTAFSLSFDVNDIHFSYSCKLVSLQFITKPNDVPTLQVGLQR